MGETVLESAAAVGRVTNNRAEYLALLTALEAALDAGLGRLDVYGDSQLVVRQVMGELDVNDEGLAATCRLAQELLGGVEEWSLSHVPRSENRQADRLADGALAE